MRPLIHTGVSGICCLYTCALGYKNTKFEFQFHPQLPLYVDCSHFFTLHNNYNIVSVPRARDATTSTIWSSRQANTQTVIIHRCRKKTRPVGYHSARKDWAVVCLFFHPEVVCPRCSRVEEQKTPLCVRKTGQKREREVHEKLTERMLCLNTHHNNHRCTQYCSTYKWNSKYSHITARTF